MQNCRWLPDSSRPARCARCEGNRQPRNTTQTKPAIEDLTSSTCPSSSNQEVHLHFKNIHRCPSCVRESKQTSSLVPSATWPTDLVAARPERILIYNLEIHEQCYYLTLGFFGRPPYRLHRWAPPRPGERFDRLADVYVSVCRCMS